MSSSNVHSKYSAANANPQGPGDARPTTTQILQDEGLSNLPNRLSGKTVLITGGTSGLGLEVAKALHQAGAKIFIAGRCDTNKGQQIATSIQTSSATNASSFVHFVQMDLSDLASVETGAENFLSKAVGKLNLLICNAGVMAPQTRTTTEQGHETQFGVNHLAHFLLFEKLRSALLASSTKDFASRVISVSSCAHRGGALNPESDYDFETTKYEPLVAYSQSKTANIYMANEIERQFGAQGLHGLSVHPGVIMDTGLVRHLTDDHTKLEEMFAQNPTFRPRTKNPSQGAATILWTAITGELEGKGGLYTEDCEVGEPNTKKDGEWWDPGTSEWCYDQGAEEKLWADSRKLVGEWL